MKVHLIAQSHIDPVFMWGWEEGLSTTLNTCAEAVRKLVAFPELRFSRSDALAHQWCKQFYPELWPEIQRLCEEERWIPVGGWYTQADTNLPAGESLIRQALVGQQVFDQLLNHRSDVAYLVDSFGHPATLPKILNHCGFRYFVLGRPREPLMTMPCDLVYWNADDGSSVLAFRIPLGYSTYANEIERVGYSVDRAEGHLNRTMCFFGLGNHGGGPTTQQIRRLFDYARHPEAPELVFSHPKAYFEEAETEESPETFIGNFEPFAIGCYSAAIRLKTIHDRAQQELLDAERWLALANSVSPDQARNDRFQLAEAWRSLLFTQFHDLLPGTGIREGLEHAEHMAASALAKANEVKTTALTQLSRQIESREEGYVRLIVFNSATTDRTVYFEYEPWLFWQNWKHYQLLDENDQPVSHQKIHPKAAARAIVRLVIKLDVPGHGYRSLRVVGPEPDFSNLAIDDDGQAEHTQRSIDTLTTPRYRVDFDPQNGTLRNCTHLPSTRPMHLDHFLDAEVSEDLSDTWSMHITGYTKPLGRFSQARSVQIEDGPLRWCVKICRTYQASTLEQEIRLFEDSDIIECRNHVNWQQPRCVLKMLIPSPYTSFRVNRGLAFGSDSVPEERHEFCFQNWLLIEPTSASTKGPTHGVAILAGPGLHAADVTERGVRLTIVRSPIYCHEELNQSYTPGVRHETMDLGESRSAFALLPLWESVHPAELVDRAQHLSTGICSITTDSHEGTLACTGQLLRVEPNHVAITAIKPAESSEGVIVRLWETAGRPTTAKLKWLGHIFDITLPAHGLRAVHLYYAKNEWRHQSVNGLEIPLSNPALRE